MYVAVCSGVAAQLAVLVTVRISLPADVGVAKAWVGNGVGSAGIVEVDACYTSLR